MNMNFVCTAFTKPSSCLESVKLMPMLPLADIRSLSALTSPLPLKESATGNRVHPTFLLRQNRQGAKGLAVTNHRARLMVVLESDLSKLMDSDFVNLMKCRDSQAVQNILQSISTLSRLARLD